MILRTFALLVALASAPVLAQSETGTRIGGRPAQAPLTGTNAQRARIWLEGYATCIASRKPKQTADVLDGPVGTVSAAAASKLVYSIDECLSSGGEAQDLRMSGRLLRGALYAENVTRTVRRLTPEMIAGRTPDLRADPSMAGLLSFGDCVMRADPAGALRFVVARATLGEESKALAVINPAMSRCIDAGSDVKLSRSIIEAGLAEAIYRTLRTPAAVAPPMSKN